MMEKVIERIMFFLEQRKYYCLRVEFRIQASGFDALNMITNVMSLNKLLHNVSNMYQLRCVMCHVVRRVADDGCVVSLDMSVSVLCTLSCGVTFGVSFDVSFDVSYDVLFGVLFDVETCHLVCRLTCRLMCRMMCLLVCCLTWRRVIWRVVWRVVF